MTDITKVPAPNPDWLPGAIEQMQKTISGLERGIIPQKIAGWMLQVACLRLLRTIYGSNLATAEALTAKVIEDSASSGAFVQSTGGVQ